MKINLTPRKAIKLTVNAVVGFGVSTIVRSIISENVDTDDMNLPKETSVNAASIVLGLMAAEASEKFINAKIDNFAADMAKAKAERIAATSNP